MIEDKKRKPSRDYPAHAQIPLGKVKGNVLDKSSRVRVELSQTVAHAVPPMNDPYRILNADGGAGSSFPPRSCSMISTDSYSSMISLEDPYGVNSRDDAIDPDSVGSSFSIPKNERPPQPANEREYFERLWAENFERSEALVTSTSAYIPVGAAGRLNRIKGFSFARDAATNKLYAVFRLEIECIVNEKQWTIYRRFHDFKQLAHQLKYQSIRVPTLPTKTLMRSLDTNFLRKRQLELDRWLREVLMLISLENCKVDTDKHTDCCGNKGYHTACQIIRHFLTHLANQPPIFENIDVPGSGPGRPPLHSISESKSMPPSPTHQRSSMRLSMSTSSQIDLLSNSLRNSDLNDRSGIQHQQQSFNIPSRSSEERRSVVVEDVEEDIGESQTRNGGRRSGKVSLKDFDVLRMIGKGSFGKVLLVRKKHTSQLYAIKILSKPVIVQKQQVEHTRTERRVLASINHPFVVCLHYAFQTKDKLYFVLDYCPGGDLFFHLSRCGYFPEDLAKFYTAEIVLALIHLHEQGIIYRDLKPENIMLDVDGHVKLADFGLAKEGITTQLDGTYTMCGTPEYLPPEILNRGGHGSAVDWWNLGMVLYEMLTGRPPWYTQDREELFKRLREAELEFPEGLSIEAMDLIQGLLIRDPAKRLGAMDPREVTFHPFFADIDWNLLYRREIQPIYRPCQYTDPIDAANFEEEFTKLPLTQIDSEGLNVASDVTQTSQPSHGLSTNESVSGRRNSTAGSAASAGRNSTLRNLSYTFAGFTYEGESSFADANGSLSSFR